MMTTRLDLEWEILASLLPVGWRELAKETGAVRRRRGELQDPKVLLQVLLLHVATGLSLKQAAARATAQGIAKLSDVALLKRLRSSEDFLRELSLRLFAQSQFGDGAIPVLAGHRLRAVDATTVEEPGSTGTDWRVHYSIGLPQMACDFYEVTDDKGGETYRRIPVHSGDVLLGDRGYCHREGVAHVLKQGGDVIVRLSSSSFPLLQAEDFSDFPLLQALRSLSGHTPSEWPVCFAAEQTLWNARLCAVRKSPAIAERAKQKLRRDAQGQDGKAADAGGRRVSVCAHDAAEGGSHDRAGAAAVSRALANRAVFQAAQVAASPRARSQTSRCFGASLHPRQAPDRTPHRAAPAKGPLFFPLGIRLLNGAVTGVNSSKPATMSSPS